MDYPRKRTSVSTEAVGDGLGIFDQQQQQAYVLNATSTLVWQHCDGQTTPQQLTELLRQQFNLPRAQAEQVTWMALEELAKANLLEATIARPQPLSAALTRRQMLTGAATAGLALALVPLVAPVPVQADAGHTLIPLLDCVVDNGDGTFTACFGYTNQGTEEIILPVGSKNMFVSPPHDQGQPILFEPGTHNDIFKVTFDEADTIKWMLKADGDRRHQVEASADSELCPTTTTPPTTTTAPPTTTTASAPFTTTTAPAPFTTTTAPAP